MKPPFRIKWIRRYEGTTKHFSTCGGGRMYTHTAEGQIFAVEQETGRLLWRRYYPGVHICYTSPLYHQERLLVPQAGLKHCFLRCLDAASGDLLWEAPFTGSPSWNRQLPPIVHNELAIYAFSTGKYAADRWLVGHGEVAGFPKSQKPLVRAYDINTGKAVWTADFSAHGSGGDDAGVCLMDGTLYYSCFFGFVREPASGMARATGITAAIDPGTGRVLWSTAKHAVHSGCTISAKDGRLYLGGYSRVDAKTNRVWCLSAKDGSLIWQSDPVQRAIHVITIGPRFLFTHAQYENGYLIDKQTGKIVRTLTEGYKCTRFTLSPPYLLGANMDVHDLSDTENIDLLSTGPAVDPSLCLGAIVSNGRLFYTAHGSGLQTSLTYGAEAASTAAPWESASRPSSATSDP
jgi:outer membrane protein assembly factor BamB